MKKKYPTESKYYKELRTSWILRGSRREKGVGVWQNARLSGRRDCAAPLIGGCCLRRIEWQRGPPLSAVLAAGSRRILLPLLLESLSQHPVCNWTCTICIIENATKLHLQQYKLHCVSTGQAAHRVQIHDEVHLAIQPTKYTLCWQDRLIQSTKQDHTTLP